MYEWAILLIKAGKAYVCDLNADADARAPGNANRTRPQQPEPRPFGRGEPRTVRAHAQGRVPRRFPHAAGQNRHGIAEYQPARSGHVPYHQGAAPPPGRQMVPLPHVRLGARTRRLHRKHLPLALFARVRNSSAALRLVSRPASHPPSAADGVRAAQPDLHRHEQT